MHRSGGGILIMREDVHAQEQGIYGKSLYLPLNFAVNVEIENIKSIFKNISQ